MRTALIVVAGLTPLAWGVPATAAAPARAAASSWGKPIASSQRIAVTAGAKVTTSQLPVTSRTGKTLQQPRFTRSAAKAGHAATSRGSLAATSVAVTKAASPAVPNAGNAATACSTTTPITGVSDTDQTTLLEPPDTILAVSPNHIVEMVNTQLLVINRADCSRNALVDLNTWFGLDPAGATSGGMTDPQVTYDPGSGRFFATGAHEIVNNGTLTGGGVRLAVSGADDPTTWTPFKVGTDSSTDFLDQPKLGVTTGKAPNPDGWVMVSWNDFTASTQNFVGGDLVALDKATVIAAAADSTLNGTATGAQSSLFGIVPSRQTVADPDAFAMYNLGAVNFMGAIRWDGTQFLGAGLPIAPTALAPDAAQPAGGTVIPGACTSPCLDTGDDRVESAVLGQNGVMWTGLNDACDPGGGVRACVRIDQFSVTDAAAGTVSDGDLAVQGWDLFYPAVELDSAGNLVVGLNVSNASTFPSTAVTGLLGSSNGNFAGIRIIHQGTAPYTGQRWGDYSGAAVDPSNAGIVWIGDEESTSGGAGNWTTTLAPVSLGAANTTTPATIAPPNLDQLGCCAASGSGVAAASWQPNRLDLFIRGTDNQLWHKWWDGFRWNGFEPQGGVTMDNPAVVSWGPNRIDLFIRGTDNQLWHKWWDGVRWNGWEPLGGVLTSAPTVTTWGPGRLDVFARGTSNQLIHAWWDGTRWNGWQSLGGVLTSAPGAVAWAPGRIDVVVRGTPNGIFHTFFDGNWHSFDSLGGVAAGDPRISSWGTGRLDVWIEGPSDSALYHKWWANGWSNWTDEAESLAGPPGAVSWAAERQDVFWIGSDLNIHHIWAG